MVPMRGEPHGPILLVEDHADLREATTDLLGLIVLDLEMPRKDGWEFRSEQMHDPRRAAIPTIISSADDDVRQKAAALGIAGYFEKRGGFDGLLDVVARYCLVE